MALCDCDSFPDVFVMLEALLFGLHNDDDPFGSRIDVLTGSGGHSTEHLPHWDDPDHLSHHVEYHASFPEVVPLLL